MTREIDTGLKNQIKAHKDRLEAAMRELRKGQTEVEAKRGKLDRAISRTSELDASVMDLITSMGSSS